jgi:hypothetical protein
MDAYEAHNLSRQVDKQLRLSDSTSRSPSGSLERMYEYSREQSGHEHNPTRRRNSLTCRKMKRLESPRRGVFDKRKMLQSKDIPENCGRAYLRSLNHAIKKSRRRSGSKRRRRVHHRSRSTQPIDKDTRESISRLSASLHSLHFNSA